MASLEPISLADFLTRSANDQLAISKSEVSSARKIAEMAPFLMSNRYMFLSHQRFEERFVFHFYLIQIPPQKN